MDVRTGQFLIGRSGHQYELLQRRGADGLATLYLARRQHDATDHFLFALDERIDKVRDAFLIEIEAIRAALGPLESDSILGLVDSGLDRGTTFVVTEYTAGNTLNSLLESGQRVTVEEALFIIEQVARGLHSAVETGAIRAHRNLHPTHLILADGAVKIGALGLAEAAEKAGIAPLDYLSPSYLSPEQTRAERWDEIDVRSDLYTLGCIAFQLLEGRLPFDGKGSDLILRRLREQPAIAHPDVPFWLRSVVERAMSIRPDERYQSAAELVAAIETMEDGPLSSHDAEENDPQMTAEVTQLRNQLRQLEQEVRQLRERPAAPSGQRSRGSSILRTAALILALATVGLAGISLPPATEPATVDSAALEALEAQIAGLVSQRDQERALEADLLTDLGWQYRVLENHSAAENAFQSALEQSPNQPRALEGLGWTYYSTERYEEAIANFEAALDVDPEATNAFNGIGFSYVRLEQCDPAVSAFEQVLAMVPEEDGLADVARSGIDECR